jgi:hypothetical protein
MNKSSVDSIIEQHRASIRKNLRAHEAVDFFNILTGPWLFNLTESLLPDHRERLYPPAVTLSMFIKQSLDEDGVVAGVNPRLSAATCFRIES